uniref:Retrovirus-related Pol polyprotein from transposon 412 n=1 Tax=Schistocephalus solidus TaxID=70667 RepID=A0A0V0J9I8_SCHSO
MSFLPEVLKCSIFPCLRIAGITTNLVAAMSGTNLPVMEPMQTPCTPFWVTPKNRSGIPSLAIDSDPVQRLKNVQQRLLINLLLLPSPSIRHTRTPSISASTPQPTAADPTPRR